MNQGSAETCPKLTALAAIVGGQVARELEQLLASNRHGLACSRAIEMLQNGGAKTAPTRVVRCATKVSGVEATAREKALAGLTLLRAEAKGPASFVEAKRDVAKVLGWVDRKNVDGKLRGFAARLHGGHRGDFVFRILNVTEKAKCDALLAELARLYTQLDGGKAVNSKELKAEAEQAGAAIARQVRKMVAARRRS